MPDGATVSIDTASSPPINVIRPLTDQIGQSKVTAISVPAPLSPPLSSSPLSAPVIQPASPADDANSQVTLDSNPNVQYHASSTDLDSTRVILKEDVAPASALVITINSNGQTRTEKGRLNIFIQGVGQIGRMHKPEASLYKF